MARLPQYTQLEKDYMGQVRLLEVINSLYGIPLDETIVRRAEQQIKDIDIEVNRSHKIKEIITHLETTMMPNRLQNRRKKNPGYHRISKTS